MIHRQPGSNGDTNAVTRRRAAAVRVTTASDKITHQNLEIVRADVERNLLLVARSGSGVRRTGSSS